MDSRLEEVQKRDWERSSFLRELERWFETPMVVLALIWLVLLVLELTTGLSLFLEKVALVIWGVFLLEFALRWFLAPRKWKFLLFNWLTVLSLVLPAFRVFRAFRMIRVLRLTAPTRGFRLLRVLSSLNRGMHSLRRTLRKRGFIYVVALTMTVTLSGAAGMYAFEHHPNGVGLNDFGTALWWTAMVMTTMGSQYWPQTPEGRILCLLLAVYAFTVFGYVTATIATFFLDQDTKSRRRYRQKD